MNRAVSLALLLVVSLALVAAGCGGDDEPVPPDEWADSFCSAVSTWTDELGQIRDRFGDLSSLDRDSLEDAANDASAATEDLVNDLQALGEPDTESGQEIEQSIETLSDTLETEKGDVEEAVEGVDDVTDIPSAITTIGAAFTAMGTALQDSFDAIENEDVRGEVTTALDQSEACEGIVT